MGNYLVFIVHTTFLIYHHLLTFKALLLYADLCTLGTRALCVGFIVVIMIHWPYFHELQREKKREEDDFQPCSIVLSLVTDIQLYKLIKQVSFFFISFSFIPLFPLTCLIHIIYQHHVNFRTSSVHSLVFDTNSRK